MGLRYDVLASAAFITGVILTLQQAHDWRQKSNEEVISAEALRGRSGFADAPTRQLQVCKDAKGTAWCARKKGKCSRSSVYRKCELTCGRCTPEAAPTPAPPTSAPVLGPVCSNTKSNAWCKKRESKCARPSVYQRCLLTCDRCDTSAPQPAPSTSKTPAPSPVPSTSKPPSPAPDTDSPAPAPSVAPELAPSPRESVPAPGPMPSEEVPSPAPAVVCKDAKPKKWCTDRAGKCDKQRIYSKCRLSCGRCQTSTPSLAPTPKPTSEPHTPLPTTALETPQPTADVETPAPTQQAPIQDPQTPQPTQAQTSQPPNSPTAAPPTTPAPTPEAAVAGEVRRLAQEISWMIGNSTDLGSALGGVLRLAFHDAGTFDGATGGADGCVDLNSAENGGLAPVVDMLEPIVAGAETLSRADVWQLAANVALEYAGGPAMEFRRGRIQASSCAGHASLLPDAEQGHNHIRDVFVTRLQFTDREVAALMGAHVLGRATAANSGYMGQWVPGNANTMFTNLYFRDMLRVRWNRLTRAPFHGMGRTEWRGPPNTGTVMLNTDIETAFDTSGCNSAGGNGNCPRAQHAFSAAVTEFSSDQQIFFDTFRVAWTKMSALGAGSLTCALEDCSTPGPFVTPGAGNGGGGPQPPGGGNGGGRRRRGGGAGPGRGRLL